MKDTLSVTAASPRPLLLSSLSLRNLFGRPVPPHSLLVSTVIIREIVAAVALGHEEEIVHGLGIERGEDSALAGVRDRTGSALVIPKAHYVDIFDIPAIELSNVYKVAKTVSAAIKKATKADGISIIQQNGKAAGQDIFHLHVHVVPRFEGQKLPRFSDLKEVERTKLDDMAQKIRKLL